MKNKKTGGAVLLVGAILLLLALSLYLGICLRMANNRLNRYREERWRADREVLLAELTAYREGEDMPLPSSLRFRLQALPLSAEERETILSFCRDLNSPEGDRERGLFYCDLLIGSLTTLRDRSYAAIEKEGKAGIPAYPEAVPASLPAEAENSRERLQKRAEQLLHSRAVTCYRRQNGELLCFRSSLGYVEFDADSGGLRRFLFASGREGREGAEDAARAFLSGNGCPDAEKTEEAPYGGGMLYTFRLHDTVLRVGSSSQGVFLFAVYPPEP